MGDTPGIPSRGLPRDSGSNFTDLQPESREPAGSSFAQTELFDSLDSGEDLRERGREAAAQLNFETPHPSTPLLLQPDAPLALDFSASCAAQAFFSTTLSVDDYNAETLDQALEHYRWLYGQSESWSELGGRPSREHEVFLRQLTARIWAQHFEQPAVETRLEESRLLADAYSELLRTSASGSDRSVLVSALSAWLHDFSSHPMSEEARIADLGHIAALVEAHGLGEIRPLLSEAVQTYVDEWRHLSGEDPRLAVQGRQRAFILLSQTHEALGRTARHLWQDLVDELNQDAVHLEVESREAEAPARLQSLGEVAALYQLLSSYPEAAEFYAARWQETLNTILEIAANEEVPAALRLQVNLQVLQEFESAGLHIRAAGLRQTMLSHAESALRQGRNSRASVIERYQSYAEAFGIFLALEDGTGADRTRAGWRRLLREMESVAGGRGNVELSREVGALAVEAFLQMGELDAAESRTASLRESLQAELQNPEIPESEDPNALDPRAQWLLRLGGYAQALATARAEGSEEAPDFSLFRELLADLSALGARTGQRTMALYGRFMRALLDHDPAIESIYEELRDWRPAEFAAWQDTPPLFLPEEYRSYQADPFQAMSEQIWRAQGPMSFLPRAATTLQFLSMMIEGNYSARIAAAEDEGESTLPIRRERDEMRRSLSHVQALLVSGRANSTREAILMLPQALGDEEAGRDFFRHLERVFGYTDLRGREIGNASLVSRLIDSEAIADPEIRAQAWLRLAREMIVQDSINHRCDGLIGAMLESAEAIGGEGHAPRPLMEILRNLASESRDLNDFAELHNRLAGNETLREQIQGTRDAGLYVQTMNQVLDMVFSVEGGLIMLASIFTGGLAAELAGAAMIARIGATAFTVVNGVRRMTWAARLAVGATRIGAAWVARSATELGGISIYRAALGHRQMSVEELRVRVITSLFCSLGDEFASHITRALMSRALHPLFGESARGIARAHALTEVAEFLTSGLGEMWGEEVGARVAGQAADTRPFLVRYFEETLHGSFFVAGMRTARPVAEVAGAGWQYAASLRPTLTLPRPPNLSLPSFSLPTFARVGAMGSLLGMTQALHPSVSLASVGLSPEATLFSDGTFLGSSMALLGLGAMAMAASDGSGKNRSWWQSIFRIFQPSSSEASAPENSSTQDSETATYRDAPAAQIRLQAQRRNGEVLLELMRDGDDAAARQVLSQIEVVLNELPQQERLDLVAAATDLWTRRNADLSREVSEQLPQLLGYLNEEQCGILGLILAGQLRRRMPRDFSIPLIEALGLVATQISAGDLAGIEQEFFQQTGLRLVAAVEQARVLRQAQSTVDQLSGGDIPERIRNIHELAALIERMHCRENRAEFTMVLLSLQNHPLASVGQAAFQASLSLLPLGGTTVDPNDSANLFAGPEAVLPSDSWHGGDAQGFNGESPSSHEENPDDFDADEGLAVSLEIHPERGVRSLHGTLALGRLQGTSAIRHYRVQRLFQSGGQNLVELASLSPGIPDTCLALARGQEIHLEAGQEVSFIPAVEGGSGRPENEIPPGTFFPLMLSQYSGLEDDPTPPRLQIQPDPERAGRFRTEGYGFLIFRNQEGRVRGREMRSASRLTLFDPGSGLAVDSYLPVEHSDVEVFLEDFRFLREHLEEMGFDFRRARAHLVYGESGAPRPPGPELASRLRELGLNLESVRAQRSDEEAWDLDLASGALLGESEELFNPATAPTLPPSPPSTLEGPSFYLFEEWLDSAELLAANQPELESFTRALGREWEQRLIGFPEMIRRLRDFIRSETPAEVQPGLFASLAGTLAREDLVSHAHVILEQENLSLEALFPEARGDWDSEESLARVQLIRSLVNQGIFEGDVNPIYHLARIQNSGARHLAWRDILTGLVVRGQVRRAQDLLQTFERNPRIGTPEPERAALWDLLGDIIQEVEPTPPRGNGGALMSALLAMGTGAATLLSAESAHASFEVAGQDGTSVGLLLGLGVAAAGVFHWGSELLQRGANHLSTWFRGPSEESQIFQVTIPNSFQENRGYRDLLPPLALQGITLPPSLDHLLSGALTSGRRLIRLTREATLGDNRLPPGAEIVLSPEGRILSIRELNQDLRLPGRTFPGVARIYFNEGGALTSLTLHNSMPLTEYGATIHQTVFFYPDGSLRQIQVEAGSIEGVPCLGEVQLHPNGRVKALTLREDVTLRGIRFRARNRLFFDEGQTRIHFTRSSGPPLSLGGKTYTRETAQEAAEVHLRFRREDGLVEVASFIQDPPLTEFFDPNRSEFHSAMAALESDAGNSSRHGRGGPNPGGALTALLAAGAGAATLFGAEVARAQDALPMLGEPGIDWAGWLLMGGGLVASLAYVFTQFRHSSGRLHQERIAELIGQGTSPEHRQELAEWLQREARANPELFDVRAVRHLREGIRRSDSLALDVYLALLESDHAIARQYLSAADVRLCEGMLLSMGRGEPGLQRLLNATLRSRVSARLIEEIAGRLNHARVYQEVLGGILIGNLRPALVFLHALEEARPNQIETLEDMFSSLRRAARRNYAARKLLERILVREDLSRFHELARFEVSTPTRGTGQTLVTLLAAGAGAAPPRTEPQAEATRLVRGLNSSEPATRSAALAELETWWPEAPEQVRMLLLHGALRIIDDPEADLRSRAGNFLRSGLEDLSRDQIEYFALNFPSLVDFETAPERSLLALEILERSTWLAGRSGFLRLSEYCEERLGFNLPGLAQQRESYLDAERSLSTWTSMEPSEREAARNRLQTQLRNLRLPGMQAVLLRSLPRDLATAELLPHSPREAREDNTTRSRLSRDTRPTTRKSPYFPAFQITEAEIPGVEVDLEVHTDVGVRSRRGRLAPGLVIAPGHSGLGFFRVARILATGNRELVELSPMNEAGAAMSLLVAEGEEGRLQVGQDVTFVPSSETPSEGSRGGSALTTLLALGAGAATWLGAEVAHASVNFGEAVPAGSPAWWAGAATWLGLGLLGTAYVGNRAPQSRADFDSLAEMLFQRGYSPIFSEEARIERFITYFHRASREEKTRYASELIRALERNFPADGETPLSIHIPYLELLLRQQDLGPAQELFAALGRLAPHPEGRLGTALDILQRGLLRRGVSPEIPAGLRRLEGGQSRHFHTPAWLSQLRKALPDFSESLESHAQYHALENILPIHYLDAHQSGAGAEALNGVRRNILQRLALQGWQPGTNPSSQQLAAALVDKENHLPILSRSWGEGRRLLLNGHHRIGALLTLVADGVLPEDILPRVPFHIARDVEPHRLIQRAFSRRALPNPRFALNWQELLGFDVTTRQWLEGRSWNQDLVEWIRTLRTSRHED